MSNAPFDMNAFLGQFRGFLSNPMQYMMQRKINLPQNAMQNPQAAVQQLMADGKMSQAQFNQLQQMAKQIQSNPMFAKMFW